MSHPIARSLAWVPLIVGLIPELGLAEDEA
jgi:hypothetical protein